MKRHGEFIMMGILRESLFLPLYHFGMLSLSALKSISELVSPHFPDIIKSGYAGERMIWIMLATVVVVFVVGFRVLTSGTRRAIRRLSERLNIDVVPVESMIDQMGKMPGEEFCIICIARMNLICKMLLRCYLSGKL